MKKIKSLSAKVTIVTILSLVVVITTIISLLLLNSNSIFNNLFQQEADASMQGLTYSIEDLSNVTKSVCDTYSKKSSVRHAVSINSSTEIISTANEILDLTNTDAVFFTDKSGNVMYSSLEDTDFTGLDCIGTSLGGAEVSSYQVINDKDVFIAYSSPIVYETEVVGSITTLCSLTKTEFLDKLKNITGAEFTIFVGEIRVSTTIMKDGERQIGTQLNSTVAKTVLTDKQEFVGQTEILGTKYVTKYHPVLDSDGNVLFTLFSGKNIEDVKNNISKGNYMAIVVEFISAIVITLFLRFLLAKMIKKPVKGILEVAKNLEEGDIGISNPDAVNIKTNSNDEIGQISSALGETASSLQKYIGEISSVLNSISQCDLTVTTSGYYKGDFISIKDALNNILSSLNEVMANIREEAELLANRSGQISSAAMQLSQGSTEQASTVEELSATIQEISVQVGVNAASANEATIISKKSSDEVIAGNTKMEEMLTSMNDINSASAKIENIIKTIEDIAFQTNILALNAAVEAARAGSAGKGFAVVADEVRNLASKSAEAAKQTTALIGNTINLVENGTKIANSTAETFRNIIENTQQSTDLVARISEASNAQAVAIAQVTDGMQQISQVIQNTSATAEESAATSEELASQAQILKDLVSMFKIK